MKRGRDATIDGVWILLLLVACGPTGGDDQTGDGTTSSPASSSSGGVDESTGTEPSTGAEGSEGSGTSTTGEPEPMLWAPAGQTWTSVSCRGDDDVEPLLFIEALSEAVVPPDTETCVAPVEVFETPYVLVMGIEGWDGSGGAYVLGEDGAVASSLVDSGDAGVGEFTLEVSQPWVPRMISFTIDGIEGQIELSTCLSMLDALPCRGP